VRDCRCRLWLHLVVWGLLKARKECADLSSPARSFASTTRTALTMASWRGIRGGTRHSKLLAAYPVARFSRWTGMHALLALAIFCAVRGAEFGLS